MKYFLSSFRVGNHGTKLAALTEGGSIAYIPNALDHIPRNEQKQAIERNETELRELGISVKLFDLRDYFSMASKFGEELTRFAGVWVSGGNTFVLRQAMKLSGFDETLNSLCPTSFLYGGYSAGVCVLAPDLRGLQIVDQPNQFPYTQQTETIWQGLRLLEYLILPHYQSNHPESAAIDQEVAFCKANGISYRTLRDGDALFGDDIEDIRKRIELSPTTEKRTAAAADG